LDHSRIGGRLLPAPTAGAPQIDEELLIQQVREALADSKPVAVVVAQLEAAGLLAPDSDSDASNKLPGDLKPPSPRAPPDRRFLSYADLERRYGKSRITLWRWVRAGLLPAPYETDPNSVGFASDEIEARDARLLRCTYG